MHSLDKQINAIEMLSSRPVVAVTVKHEDLNINEVPSICEKITESTGLPAFDVILHGAAGLAKAFSKYLKFKKPE